MKTLFLFLTLLLSATTSRAQADAPAVVSAADTATVTHVLFEGIEVKGDIYEFSNVLQKHGFKLEKRLGNDLSYIFKGTVCGHSSYVQVSYTKRTRTVWRVIVEPKHVSLNDYVDSLQVRYGEATDETERGYQWMLPTGAVMLFTPSGYDPKLVIMDGIGAEAYKDENN